MGIIEDRVVDPRSLQIPGQVRLPDPLRQPGSGRDEVKIVLYRRAELSDLTLFVRIGQSNENRFVISPAHHLHLSPRYQSMDAFNQLRPVRQKPIPKGPGVVKSDPHSGMAFQGGNHRFVGLLIGLFKHKVEVSHGLVIVNSQTEGDTLAHIAAPTRTRFMDTLA